MKRMRSHAKFGTEPISHCTSGEVMELSDIMQRVQAEFLEMPGLRLTSAQACRLWNLEREMCRKVIETLVAQEFLRWTPSGAVTRS